MRTWRDADSYALLATTQLVLRLVDTKYPPRSLLKTRIEMSRERRHDVSPKLQPIIMIAALCRP